MNKSEVDELDKKTRKVMTMNKKLHLRTGAGRLYVSRMEGARGLIGCKMCVKVEKNSLGCYVKHHTEPLIVAVKISNTLPSKNSTQPREFKKQDNEKGS